HPAGCGPGLRHAGSQPQNRLRFDLRDARFVQFDDLRDLAQGQLFRVIETQHSPLHRGNPVNALRQKPLEFGALEQRGRKAIALIRDVMEHVGTFARILQAGNVQPANLDEPRVVLLDRDLQLASDFLFGGRPLEALFGGCDGRFDLLGLPALLPGRPVEAAQAVENGAPDLVFRVRLELNVVARIKVVDGGDQAYDARRNQVFEANAVR